MYHTEEYSRSGGLEGYQSGITRMVFLGDPPSAFLQAYQAILEANQIRIEDIVTVTETGVRTLTGFSHELVIK